MMPSRHNLTGLREAERGSITFAVLDSLLEMLAGCYSDDDKAGRD